MLVYGNDGIAAVLQKDDKCVWFVNHGTISFCRGCEALRQENGDDKFILKPQNRFQFEVFIDVVANVTGLKPVMESDTGDRVVYRFE